MGRPKGTKTRHLTETERQRVRTLYFDANLTKGRINAITGYTTDQIRYAIRSDSSTVKPRCGRPRALSTVQESRLVGFVRASEENRKMGYLQLSSGLFLGDFGASTIKRTLNRLGYFRRAARQRPTLSPETRRTRLQWARDHAAWSPDRWSRVLWTDEAWFTHGPDRADFVTRREDEPWEPTCIVEQHQRRGPDAAMFWACFSGLGKGPALFWERDWGEEVEVGAYQQHTVPLIDRWISRCRQDLGIGEEEEGEGEKEGEGEEGGKRETLTLMHGSEPAYAADVTKLDYDNRAATVVKWPPCSPDLSPMQACWDSMKNYIEDKYGLDESPPYDKFRDYVNEAWAALPLDFIRAVLATMETRCKAVIAADGDITVY